MLSVLHPDGCNKSAVILLDFQNNVKGKLNRFYPGSFIYMLSDRVLIRDNVLAKFKCMEKI